MNKTSIVGAVALAFCVITGASAADTTACKLKQIAALDMIREPGGKIAVTVGINGAPHHVLVSLAAANSALTSDFAGGADIRQRNIAGRKHFRVNGERVETYGTIEALTIGSSLGRNISVLVSRRTHTVDRDVVGVLGTDVLGNFDLEFDFAANKINLFSTDHCPGMGGYWAAKHVEVPIDLEQLGRPASPWSLDGKPVIVTFDTASFNSSMHRSVALVKFGLDASSPGVTTAQTEDDGDVAYQYRFKSLTAEGIAIANPPVTLYGNPTQPLCEGKKHTGPSTAIPGWFHTSTCYGPGDLALGLRELSQLHLYFAFKEKLLYFTAADAH